MTSAAFVAALKPLLEARPGLAGVTVHLTDSADVTAPAIVLIRQRIRHEIEWIAMGPKRTDVVTVPGYVVTNAATELAAADQALAILSEIGLQVVTAPPPVGAQTQKANLATIEWLLFLSDKGGWDCGANYEIEYVSNLA